MKKTLSKMLIHSCMIIYYITKKHSYCYCLEAFSTAETLKNHVNDCSKLMVNKLFKIPKKKKLLDSKMENK